MNDPALTYADYLQLERLLQCQLPLSEQHDEMLFIVIHQATELWLKLALHEVQAAMRQIRADDLAPAFKMLSRFSRIQSQLIQSWDVLSTLTPADYLTFRDRLGSASGLQSVQYRLIEFVLGNKDPAHLRRYPKGGDAQRRLGGALHAPSLYQEALLLLARRGFTVPLAPDADFSVPHTPQAAITDAWLQVYRDTHRHWDLYELAEKLVDVEDWFRQWRYRHLTTVERIIGNKRGTGGTTGASYLRHALETQLFPELWEVRTNL